MFALCCKIPAVTPGSWDGDKLEAHGSYMTAILVWANQRHWSLRAMTRQAEYNVLRLVSFGFRRANSCATLLPFLGKLSQSRQANIAGDRISQPYQSSQRTAIKTRR